MLSLKSEHGDIKILPDLKIKMKIPTATGCILHIEDMGAIETLNTIEEVDEILRKHKASYPSGLTLSIYFNTDGEGVVRNAVYRSVSTSLREYGGTFVSGSEMPNDNNYHTTWPCTVEFLTRDNMLMFKGDLDSVVHDAIDSTKINPNFEIKKAEVNLD